MDTKVKPKKAPIELKDMKIEKIYPYKTGFAEYDPHIIQREIEAAKLYPDNTLPTVIDPDVRIGIEVEVENVYRYNDMNLHCWGVHEDNSLRNSGREFVTWPIKGQTIPRALMVLFKDILRPGYDFSKRTSVHIHMNVRNMTPSQVAAYVCLFIVFEKLLYKFVGNNRDKNIFCVPMQQTLISNELLPAMDSGFKNIRWYKYAGLNLLPIHTLSQGSVEMRQLHGTDDVDLIVSWINLLLRMRQYAVSDHLDTILSEIRDLNTNSQYDMFMRKIFQNESRLLDTSAIGKDMESGVICVKQSTLINRFHQGMLEGSKQDSLLLAPMVEETKAAMRRLGYNYDGSRINEKDNNLVRASQQEEAMVADPVRYTEDYFDFDAPEEPDDLPQPAPIRLEGTRNIQINVGNTQRDQARRDILNRVMIAHPNLMWATDSVAGTGWGDVMRVDPALQNPVPASTEQF